nr:MAG TPA: hypothetical protein [Caudoviricetes sp.]
MSDTHFVFIHQFFLSFVSKGFCFSLCFRSD